MKIEGIRIVKTMIIILVARIMTATAISRTTIVAITLKETMV